MEVENSSKMRLLRLWQILQKETGEVPMNSGDVRKRLESEGFSCDRRTLASDLDTLMKAGFPVKRHRAQHGNAYSCCEKLFTDSEAKILFDTVCCASYIPPLMTQSIAEKVAVLMGRKREGALTQTRCTTDVKTANEDMATSVAVLDKAIAERKKVRFRQFDYAAEQGKTVYRHDADEIVVTPLATTVYDGQYYIYAYSPRHAGRIIHYRVDRLSDVAITEEKADVNDAILGFQPKESGREMFSMYGSDEKKRVRILFTEDITNVLVDKFGADFRRTRRSDGWCETSQLVQVSKTFFGWCCTLGTHIYLEAPGEVAAWYAKYLKELAAPYESGKTPPPESNR